MADMSYVIRFPYQRGSIVSNERGNLQAAVRKKNDDDDDDAAAWLRADDFAASLLSARLVVIYLEPHCPGRPDWGGAASRHLPACWRRRRL